MKNDRYWQNYIVNIFISYSSIMSEKNGVPATWLLQLLNKDWYFPFLVLFFRKYTFSLNFFQGASSGRSEGDPRLNRLWTLSAPGAGKRLFRPCMHPAPCFASIPCSHTPIPGACIVSLLFVRNSYRPDI